jgi:sirohydrochlorin ferrochelatase
MESPEGPGFEFNRPLFAEALAHASPRGDVLVAPLFLSPGRHAGPGGDLFRIAECVKSTHPTLRYHFTELPGTLPDIVSILAGSLSASISSTLPSSLL